MASTYLTRTPSSAGNRKTMTWSFWIKRSELKSSGDNIIFQTNVSTYTYCTFSNDNFRWQDGNGGNRITNRLFRDTSAWYHIVVAVDTTEATASDRIKIWINGVQETSFSTSTDPSLNQDLEWNKAQEHNIGRHNTAGAYFDGLMSHFHFIDGTAYDASYFGQFDSNGVWTIKTSPSVTYGTNGFFILKDGNSVTDQSGNGNNFTVSGGTLTNTEDNPSNVFATMNPLDNFYNSSTFSNGNNTVQTSTSQYTYNTSTLGVSSGKWYCEIEYDATSYSDNATIGVISQFSTASSMELGNNSNDWGYYANGSIINNNSISSYGNSYTVGDIIGIALDLDNNKLYFSKNGTWQNSGDPTSGATGTGAISITDPASTNIGSYFIAICHYDASSNGTYKANFGNGYFGTTAVASAGTNASGIGIFEYDIPTGYTALSTKGLNL